MHQIYNNGCESVNCIVTQLLSNDKCEASSRKIMALWKDLITRSKNIVQLVATIDYGMPFCKSCFNLEEGADGLAFVAGEEIKKLEKIIYGINSICINRTTKANKVAEGLVNQVITLQISVITEKEIELSDIVKIN